MSKTAEVHYLVVPDSENPYLLAKVRWPDVAQAISAGCPDWQDDPGLFDLPYDSISKTVTFEQAGAIASAWGATLDADPMPQALKRQLIRRMPANWSNMAPAELRAWSLEFVATTPRLDTRAGTSRRSLRSGVSALFRRSDRHRDEQPAIAQLLDSMAPAAAAKRPLDTATATPTQWTPAIVMAGTADDQSEDGRYLPASAVERRRHARVHVAGRAEIRCGHETISADLVDASDGGLHFVVATDPPTLEVGTKFDAPLVLQGGGSKSEISLAVAGTVTWHSDSALGTHLGIAFDDLNEEQLQRVQDVLVSLGSEQRT